MSKKVLFKNGVSVKVSNKLAQAICREIERKMDDGNIDSIGIANEVIGDSIATHVLLSEVICVY